VSDPLIIDVYAGDLNGTPDWAKLAAAGPPWYGAYVKCTEGTDYAPQWFLDQWAALGKLTGENFFRGCYHYLRASARGDDQADYFQAWLSRAGGPLPTDLPVAVDVEEAGNVGATAARMVSTVRDFVSTLKTKYGHKEVLLYEGSFVRQLGITDQMGCDGLWTARYTATLPPATYQSLGWKLPVMWQYAGDGVSWLEGYPSESPIGKVDISAVVANGGGDVGLGWLRGTRTGAEGATP
jgi:GH25 family lysozyme M1 (1,4-beta-N-acetylmuramidase)